MGPSGAGKSTVIEQVKAHYKDRFGFSVSCTTRAPRKGEVDGKHYQFLSKEKFQEMAENDEFIEWCNVHSNMYGTTKAGITSI